MKRRLIFITLLTGLLSLVFGQTAMPDTREISLEWLFQRAEEKQSLTDDNEAEGDSIIDGRSFR